MKNTLITILIAAIMALSLTACGDSVIENADMETEQTEMFEWHKVETPKDIEGYYSVLVDKETGVCYLEFDSGIYRHSITVMLNADGTPKIWEKN